MSARVKRLGLLVFVYIFISLIFCPVSLFAEGTEYSGPDDPVVLARSKAALKKLGPDRGRQSIQKEERSLVRDIRELVNISKNVDGAGLSLRSDIREAQQKLIELGAVENDIGYKISLSGDVLFEFDKTELRTEAETELFRLVEALDGLGSTKITIIGHTDNIGTEKYNLDLSRRRAEAVCSWMKKNAEEGAIVFSVQGKGESQPIAPNRLSDGKDNPSGRAKNRRVEILIEKKEEA